MMDKFVIEIFEDGELLSGEMVESNQRLLNEQDLDVICLGKDKALIFVRCNTDVNSGYYVADDNRWDYGTREEALNTIKRRL